MARVVTRVCMLFVCVTVCHAQQSAVVRLHTNDPEAIFFADSLRLGPAWAGTFHVPVTTQTLRLVASGEDDWFITPLTMTMEASIGDTVQAQLHFPHYYRFETVPFGASALLQTGGRRTSLGKTPTLYTAKEKPAGIFVLERRGYMPVELIPGNEIWNRYVVTLQQLRADASEGAELRLMPPEKRYRWLDYSAAALALAAGVVSVHHKFKADRLDDEYRETGNPDLRPRIDRLDDRALLSLGVMQVGVVVLAVRFIIK